MLLRQLFEEINKTAVLGWGRGMGHKGHMLLAKAVLHHAQEIDAKAYFVVSRTSLVDPATGQPWADRPTFTKTKDDPLSPEEKLATYRKVFPQNADVFSVATADASTLDKVLVKIARDGFTKVTLIVGELEKDSFSFLTRPDKSGIPPYQKAGLRDLEIISRQDTSEPSSVKGSPDYQEGPRATPMRTVLTDPTKSEEEQFAVWRDAMPDNLSDDEVMDLMNKAKQRMAAVPAAKNAKKAKQAVAEGSQEINWVKPNFDFEWHEVEEQSRMKQVPVDVRQYYQKHFPNKDAWLKAVQNGKAVVVPPDHAYEIRNAPFDKASLQKVLAPTGHEGPIGPAKEKRVNDLFDKGQVEMPIILKTSQGLWLIGGKTRLGTANYVKGLPAKVWLISGEQGVAENFADGKGPGRPGDSQRHGIPKGATMAQLEKASHAKGRKGQLARWQLNMRRGRKK